MGRAALPVCLRQGTRLPASFRDGLEVLSPSRGGAMDNSRQSIPGPRPPLSPSHPLPIITRRRWESGCAPNMSTRPAISNPASALAGQLHSRCRRRVSARQSSASLPGCPVSPNHQSRSHAIIASTRCLCAAPRPTFLPPVIIIMAHAPSGRGTPTVDAESLPSSSRSAVTSPGIRTWPTPATASEAFTACPDR
jgi:hypothetical protein